MKGLKLTNLDKMQQNEMQQVKGGLNIPWVGAKVKRKGTGEIVGVCVCHSNCSGDTRVTEGNVNRRNTSR